ncbi:sodium/proton antiporter, NhaA family (TC 2.A.33.1.1) [Nocardia amikacinitolerans]|uniref:Na(+)/H(+) antiporter NhaA n=1 Tax=Nocardia amikacinitolerans TaxID=756689 RepID=A0A285L174_9NOCA|nr:Na+/H+ antiporter NhaA [Nocardia amikacinitolerans]MCP2300178.1 sodium/proton antiporter, NhaA family (TC 2.A.33.1.1) [Nocardia amikacinitolerans]SNY77807.1 sodium/proton antiporter, NhaA family (TC 2.A.33.1.1) [Nocardia amikacinitolerans]
MAGTSSPAPRRLFTPGSWPESRRIASVLREETVGGVLLIIAAAVGLIWANTPWSSAYYTLRDTRIGPESLHLNLTLGSWAADGLLAIFFFVVGLELKREFVAGDLRDPRRAALPVVAAIGGMLGPAVIFVAINLRTGGGALNGWAIPTATDIAFALAVLAVLSTHLPTALRTFLLTLAVVDDLLAVTVVAIFYTDELHLNYLGLAVIPFAAFALAVNKRLSTFWILVPLAVLTWWLIHQSGVHATVAGALLGFTVPVARSAIGAGPDTARKGLAERFEHRIRPLSAGFAVPVFAFFAAGVTLGGLTGLAQALDDPITVGIIVGLVAGKLAGITATTYLTARLTRAELDEDLRWIDVAGVGLLGGIGFTVSLLIGELAYTDATLRGDHVRIGVLLGTLAAAALAAILLRMRNRTYRLIAEHETRDDNHDGVPDLYQKP